MVKFNMVNGLPRVIPLNGVCEGCVLKKHHRATFKYTFKTGKAWREMTQWEHLHSDLCPMHKPLLASARYVLNFIDDFSKSAWLYFLNYKDHVFEKFKEFRALVENQCS
jgi:hypothetical protein